MDLLIIKKDAGVTITNQIGDIFRGHNVFEYKSPGDALTIDDYYKTVGYAYLYKGLGKRVKRFPARSLRPPSCATRGRTRCFARLGRVAARSRNVIRASTM